ncbi:MAG: hypothetical protein QME76_12390, partial [Bacillota bacterium]|nr:hypothetical protein [Bacillota bacterium]
MQMTPNFGLKKYEPNDTADLTQIGQNWDIIDNQLKAAMDAAAAPARPDSVSDDAIGNRTPDQTLAPVSPGTGKLGQILSWITNRLRAITGKANWWDAPTKSMEQLNSDLTAHLGETVLKANKTINVPTDFPTIQAALDSLKYTWIPSDVTVTIQVATGTYTHTAPIIINHPCGNQIKIVGATPVTTTCSAVGTITGSAGNWSVPITVASSSGIAAGDYVIIKGTAGTGDHYAFRGIWKVISVDSTTQITVQNTHRKSVFPTATLSGGTVVALKTILKFTSSRGIVVASNSALGFLDQVAVVGDGSAYGGILVGRAPSQAVPSPAFVWLGGNVGVNGFGADGIGAGYGGTVSAYSDVASSGNGGNGFYAGYGGSISASSSTASGNGGNGFGANYGGSISASSSTASGNGQSGFYAGSGGSISASSSTASGNGQSG